MFLKPKIKTDIIKTLSEEERKKALVNPKITLDSFSKAEIVSSFNDDKTKEYYLQHLRLEEVDY